MSSVIYSKVQEADQRSWILLCAVEYRRLINDQCHVPTVQEADQRSWILLCAVEYRRLINDQCHVPTVQEADQRSWILLCTVQYRRRINDQCHVPTVQEADQRSWILLCTVQYRRRINDHEFYYVQYNTGGGSTIMNSQFFYVQYRPDSTVQYSTVQGAFQRSWVLLCTEKYRTGGEYIKENDWFDWFVSWSPSQHFRTTSGTSLVSMQADVIVFKVTWT